MHNTNKQCKPLVAASQQWNKEAIKARDIQKRKARKAARGRQWEAIL